jgi:hypothetical protein
MAIDHRTTKRNRRPKSGHRFDPTASTMAKLKQLASTDVITIKLTQAEINVIVSDSPILAGI